MVELYNKLVRDNIPHIIEQEGKKPYLHIASGSELEEALLRKLDEEIGEFRESKDPVELVDILEVIYRLANCYSITQDKLEEMRKEKARQRGAFQRGFILERIE